MILKILALNWQDPKNPMGGGAEVHLWENLKRFAEWGHEVTLLCSDFKDGGPEDFYDGVRVIRKGKRLNFNFVAPRMVKKELRQNNYDILLEDINKIPFYTPFYVKIPILAIIPHLFATTVFQEINFVLGSYIYIMEQPLRYIYKKFPYCVISESTKKDLIRRGVSPDRITVIECGIDEETYSYDESVKKYENPTALYLGRIKKYKSIQHILTAWPKVLERVPKASLQVVGSGDYLDALKAKAEKLGISDSIEFPGFVSKKSKIERFRKAWCTVYPSLKEGWGLTNIEANACGTPALASRVPGLKDSVSDGKSGMLFEYGNIEQIASQIIKLFTDEELRICLSKGAREWAARFNWDDSAGKMIELIEKIVKEGRR
ncbi:MAG: glycosyltransferase [candidate division Zixibacteria bacterium]|nr:glycosyltransferase [candidate division Zixibacteria bacterium]